MRNWERGVYSSWFWGKFQNHATCNFCQTFTSHSCHVESGVLLRFYLDLRNWLHGSGEIHVGSSWNPSDGPQSRMTWKGNPNYLSDWCKSTVILSSILADFWGICLLPCGFVIVIKYYYPLITCKSCFTQPRQRNSCSSQPGPLLLQGSAGTGQMSGYMDICCWRKVLKTKMLLKLKQINAHQQSSEVLFLYSLGHACPFVTSFRRHSFQSKPHLKMHLATSGFRFHWLSFVHASSGHPSATPRGYTQLSPDSNYHTSTFWRC